MRLNRESRKLIVEALVYFIRAAYTEEEIRAACDFDKKLAKPMLDKRKSKLKDLKILVGYFRR